jgi:hypothetical protein
MSGNCERKVPMDWQIACHRSRTAREGSRVVLKNLDLHDFIPLGAWINMPTASA